MLLGKKAVDKLYTPVCTGIDRILGTNMTWGYGVAHGFGPGDQVSKYTMITFKSMAASENCF